MRCATAPSTFVEAFSSCSSGSRRIRAICGSPPSRKRLVRAQAKGVFDKRAGEKKVTSNTPAGKNLISPKPLYAKGEEPWYINAETGKAPAYLQIIVFMASQLFVGLVMQPFAVWYGQLFEPFLNK